MEKLTDNEIIKALECCINEDNDLFNCGKQNCVFMECKMGKDRDCLYYMMKAVLDLINRLKVEIEKLEKIEHFATQTIEKQSGEIERLKEERDEMHGDVITAEKHAWNLNEKLKIAKSEVIKEYKAMFHAYKTNIFIKGEELMIIPMSDYDNLVKEMVGDAK